MSIIICSTSLMSELCVYNQCECCKYGKHRKCQIGSNGFRSIWQMRSDVRESNRIRSDHGAQIRSYHEHLGSSQDGWAEDEKSSEQVCASDPQDQSVSNVLVIFLLFVKKSGGACCLSAPAHACASSPELLGGPTAPKVVPVAPGGVSGTWGGWACPGD